MDERPHRATTLRTIKAQVPQEYHDQIKPSISQMLQTGELYQQKKEVYILT